MSDTPERSDSDSRLDAILGEYFENLALGRACTHAELLARYPDLADELTRFFADEEACARLMARLGLARGHGKTTSPPGEMEPKGRSADGQGPRGADELSP